MSDELKVSQPIVHPGLIPEPGRESSSYTVAIVSALAPIAMLLAIIIGLIFIHEPDVRAALIQTLLYVVLPGIAAGGAVGYRYVAARGAVAVAKTEGLADVLKSQLGGSQASGDATAGASGVAISIDAGKNESPPDA